MENVSYCMDDDIKACCKEIYLFVCVLADLTVHSSRSSYTSFEGKKYFCTWTFSDRSGDFVATAPLPSGPIRHPSDSGLPVATPLFSSCHHGSLGSSYSVKLYYLSWRHGRTLCLVANCVPTPSFQSSTCTVHYYRGCGWFPTICVCIYHSGTFNRAQTFTGAKQTPVLV